MLLLERDYFPLFPRCPSASLPSDSLSLSLMTSCEDKHFLPSFPLPLLLSARSKAFPSLRAASSSFTGAALGDLHRIPFSLSSRESEGTHIVDHGHLFSRPRFPRYSNPFPPPPQFPPFSSRRLRSSSFSFLAPRGSRSRARAPSSKKLPFPNS